MGKMHQDERGELFTEFFHQHVTQLKSFTRERVPNSSDVEDICADAFALAWARIDELADLNDAQAHRWLQRVVEFRIQRTSRDFARQGRAIERISREVQKSFTSSESLVIAEIERLSEAEALQLVSEVLDQLSTDHKEILNWDIYENLKGPAIAKRLGCTPTAARLRLMRARRAFRDVYLRTTSQINEQVAE